MRSREDPPGAPPFRGSAAAPPRAAYLHPPSGSAAVGGEKSRLNRRPYPGDRGHRLLQERTGCRVFERFAKLRPAASTALGVGAVPGPTPEGCYRLRLQREGGDRGADRELRGAGLRGSPGSTRCRSVRLCPARLGAAAAGGAPGRRASSAAASQCASAARRRGGSAPTPAVAAAPPGGSGSGR